jgi:hypothetical protein
LHEVVAALTDWVRADWRRRRSALVGLCLLIGLVGSVAMAAIAGARRTATTVERLADHARSADASVTLGPVPFDVAQRAAAVPAVGHHGIATIVFAIVDGVDADIGLFVPRDDRLGVAIEADPIVRGRRADPSDASEVVVTEGTARLLGRDVGEPLEVLTLTPEQVAAEEYFPPQGPTLRLEIVGVSRGPQELSARDDGSILATPALYDAVEGRVDEFATALAVDLTPGVTLDDLHEQLRDAVGDGFGMTTLDVRTKPAQRTVSALATGLAWFGVIALLVGAALTAQVVGRHVGSLRGEQHVLRHLGVTAHARTLAVAATCAPVAIGGAVLGALGAALASPLLPIGLARRAEPDPGFAFDWPVLLGGATATGVLVVAAALAAAAWTVRRGGLPAVARPSTATRFAARVGAGPVTTMGLRFALPLRRPALPVRSSLASLALVAVGATAATGFSAALGSLLDSPSRWGYGWDLTLSFTSSEVDDAAKVIVADDGFEAVGRWDAGFTTVEGAGLRAYGLARERGDIGFALTDGRQPAGRDEAVIGPETARRLDVEVGDRVAVLRPDDPSEGGPAGDTAGAIDVQVVGIALFPQIDEGNFADAIGFERPAFLEHAVVPDLFEASQVVVRLAPGADGADATAGVETRFPGSTNEAAPARPDDVASLDALRFAPGWVIALLAVLGAATLLHLGTTTAWRGRDEIATLRAIGMSARQLVACAATQHLVLVVAAVAVGIPTGLAVGRGTWSGVADSVDVQPRWAIPTLGLLASSTVALAASAALGATVAWMTTARRRSVAGPSSPTDARR